MARTQYLFKVLKKYLNTSSKECLFCKSKKLILIGRKYYLVQLLQCTDCKLMFRYPTDSLSENEIFYQNEYTEGVTTEFPDERNLEKLPQIQFSRTDNDFSEKIEIVKQFKLNGKLLDFGSSWGYSLYQFRQAGFDSIGFEISKARSNYAKTKLGLTMIDDYQSLNNFKDGSFDIIFCNHVLEHLPNLYQVFGMFRRLLSDGGYLVIFVPDCSEMEKRSIFKIKKRYAFGEKHTIAFNNLFFESNLPKLGFEVKYTRSPYDINNLFNKEKNSDGLEYRELFVLCRKII